MVTHATRSRTHQERVEAIFNFIETQEDPFPKSHLKEIGLNPRSAEVWLKLIDYIQRQPRIRLVETEHTLLVEKVEGKYQALLRNRSLDETLSFEQRLNDHEDYIKSQYAREQTKELQKHRFPMESDPHTILLQLREAFSTLSILDPEFDQYARILNTRTSNPEEIYFALVHWQKQVLLDTQFQALLSRVYEREDYLSRIRKLTRLAPDFEHRLKLAEKLLTAHYESLRENLADFFFESEHDS